MTQNKNRRRWASRGRPSQKKKPPTNRKTDRLRIPASRLQKMDQTEIQIEQNERRLTCKIKWAMRKNDETHLEWKSVSSRWNEVALTWMPGYMASKRLLKDNGWNVNTCHPMSQFHRKQKLLTWKKRHKKILFSSKYLVSFLSLAVCAAFLGRVESFK